MFDTKTCNEPVSAANETADWSFNLYNGPCIFGPPIQPE